ncbi:hypothetical protein [Dickeya chrysanthemi]|uniref:hypothetical protein n=1 Tax=Dickeya chrysanthemi TaxID=556 RepID=UPI003015B98E
MKFLDGIANTFFSAELIDISDDFNRCSAIYQVQETTISHDYIARAYYVKEQLALHQLTYDIAIKCNDISLVTYSQASIPEEIHTEIENQLRFVEDNSKLDIDIKIYKSNSHNNLNTSHIFNFKNYISGPILKSDFEFLNFLKQFNLSKKIKIKCWESITEFSTSTIIFEGSNTPLLAVNNLDDRQSIISKRNKCCHFTNDVEYRFTPDDFHLITECTYPEINEKFERLTLLFSLIYLSDYSEIIDIDSKIILDYKMKGYRLISNKLDLTTANLKVVKELYGIYQWIYNQGNFVDKIGLAKNIISIHMTNNDITSLSSGALRSIESGYDIYLKENVKQYIEIKNKISELLISQSDKASEITKNMLGTLKTSFWSVVTFFITVILVRLITSKGDGIIFTGEVAIMTYLFIFFSGIYHWLSECEVNEDKARLFDRYTTIKDRYKDLLNEEDLKKVIDIEQLKEKDQLYIRKRRKTYRIIWILFNIVMFLSVTAIYFYGKNTQKSSNVPSITQTTEITTPNSNIKNKVPTDNSKVQIKPKPSPLNPSEVLVPHHDISKKTSDEIIKNHENQKNITSATSLQE